MVKIRYTSLNKQEAFYLISLSIVQNVKELFKLVPKVNEPQTPSLTSNKKNSTKRTAKYKTSER